MGAKVEAGGEGVLDDLLHARHNVAPHNGHVARALLRRETRVVEHTKLLEDGGLAGLS